jgi:hypothetical protein
MHCGKEAHEHAGLNLKPTLCYSRLAAVQDMCIFVYIYDLIGKGRGVELLHNILQCAMPASQALLSNTLLTYGCLTH